MEWTVILSALSFIVALGLIVGYFFKQEMKEQEMFESQFDMRMDASYLKVKCALDKHSDIVFRFEDTIKRTEQLLEDDPNNDDLREGLREYRESYYKYMKIYLELVYEYQRRPNQHVKKITRKNDGI